MRDIIMAELKCGVDNCSYNAQQRCSKGDIMVGGKHAQCCQDTCCESFAEKKAGGYVSSLEHPCKTISIDCEATAEPVTAERQSAHLLRHNKIG